MPSAPPGWKLVPMEPTEEMWQAARYWYKHLSDIGHSYEKAMLCYQHIAAAAPEYKEE